MEQATALTFNVVSALTFPLGGVIAWALSGEIDVAWILPFAAANFLYIGATDLIPQLRARELEDQLAQFAAFLVGLAILLAIAFV